MIYLFSNDTILTNTVGYNILSQTVVRVAIALAGHYMMLLPANFTCVTSLTVFLF